MTVRWPGLARLPRTLVIMHDLTVVVLTWLGLHWLAGQAGAPPPIDLGVQLAVVLSVQALVFWHVGLYRGVWRFASVPDLVNLAKAAFLALLLFVPVFLVLGMPCSPSGIAQPMITSAICFASMPGACATTALSTWDSRSAGWALRNTPRGALPTGVRVAATM